MKKILKDIEMVHKLFKINLIIANTLTVVITMHLINQHSLLGIPLTLLTGILFLVGIVFLSMSIRIFRNLELSEKMATVQMLVAYVMLLVALFFTYLLPKEMHRAPPSVFFIFLVFFFYQLVLYGIIVKHIKDDE